jgi:hemoglobin
MPLSDQEIYGVIGEEGFARLVAAFYRRVRTDDILGPMYPEHDFDGAEKRLRQFLIFRFGGPQTYIMERGHPRLRMRHAPFPVDRAARDRWVSLMDQALEEVALPAEAEEVLKPFFHDVATFLMNRGEP